MKVLNFQGTVAFFKKGRLDPMQYFHVNDNGIEQERLLSLNSPMREVIREAGKVSCVFRDSKEVVIDHRPVGQSFIINLPDVFSDTNAAYLFSFQGEESVAMLPTRIILVKAKDEYRYDRKIWVDKQHFLPLKVEVYDLSGETLEQVVFMSLKVVDKLEFVKAAKNTGNTKIKHIHKLESSSFAQADYELKDIPPGFKKIFFTKMNMENVVQPVDHLLLSDGFSSISVYREAKTNDVKLCSQALDTVNSFTNLVDNFQITAMGEVPSKTVKLIAQSVKIK